MQRFVRSCSRYIVTGVAAGVLLLSASGCVSQRAEAPPKPDPFLTELPNALARVQSAHEELRSISDEAKLGDVPQKDLDRALALSRDVADADAVLGRVRARSADADTQSLALDYFGLLSESADDWVSAMQSGDAEMRAAGDVRADEAQALLGKLTESLGEPAYSTQ